ncbi:ABC transporter ATP-binding protein [Nesterenkonia salmonea]|uniref:Spermidine/putrescine import ATP-binding protein PotA n=1 Tax=Nesterenkonia salmonea TaxID=1804987 RepID=A0A5R9BKB4_9MICC|nr:ABC transporter ATP-binding protein [Nesterenkonia salmonea]TLQ01057.1 ABC transporter ATP-binding protein [Nesterenkonia salmonea]
MPVLELQGLTKKYGDFTAVDSVDLAVEAGEFVTLLGPSGSGKTTILQMIAGFHIPSEGSIQLRGQDISSMPTHKRNMGFVFQDYALFPHMTVFQNIAYPLKIRKRPRKQIKKSVEETIALVQLEKFAHRKPHELSGGQQQRVALARSLVFQPELILMDEPLGALDKNLRGHVQLEIKRIQEITNVTIIFVTHDQEEALVMSDRIAVLNESKLIQYGSPRELYEAPNSYFVADFIGENNFIPGTVTSLSQDDVTVQTVQGRELSVPLRGETLLEEGCQVHISIRPEELSIDDDHAAAAGKLRGRISTKVYMGNSVKYIVKLENHEEVELSVSAGRNALLKSGDSVGVSWADVEHVRLIAK